MTPDQYASAAPFPHAVIHDHWNPKLLDLVAAEFPDTTDPRWRRYGNAKEMKLEGGPALWGPAARTLALHLAAREWVTFLEHLTGIDQLQVDFTGGGMHCIPRPGYLAPHVDFDHHPDGRFRRLNVLVFLNRDYDHEHGGPLELFDGEGPVVSIPPSFNTTVIFTCSSSSWHGHPKPWRGPQPRRSFAAYGYTLEAPAETGDPHDTIWMGT
jgi:hypothetical protein